MTPFQAVAKPEHVPFFITHPGQTDVLFGVIAVVLLGAVLAAGILFFWLHSLPERMVHNRVQFDIVAVLCLLSLFTHIHAFWVAALLLAIVKFPSFSAEDFSGPLDRIANSVERAVDSREPEAEGPSPTPMKPLPSSAPTSSSKPSVSHAQEVKHA
jgi:multisubunit Na+/H+ antiporter MnhF subunit